MVGSVRHPINTADFSAFVLQAMNSHADVIILANGGADTINTVKQAHEFGTAKSGQTLVATGLFITDVNSLGLETAQGLTLSTGFYWDRDDATRAWSQRFFKIMNRMPTREQAETYSAVSQYIKGVVATNSKEAAAVMAWMKKTPVDDFYAPGAMLREDGRLLHPIYLAKMKSPAESKYPWDYYQIIGTLQPDKAFRPLSEGGCAFVPGHCGGAALARANPRPRVFASGSVTTRPPSRPPGAIKSYGGAGKLVMDCIVDVAGKNIIMTGAGQGIGRAIAGLCLRLGANVTVLLSRTASARSRPRAAKHACCGLPAASPTSASCRTSLAIIGVPGVRSTMQSVIFFR